MTAVNPARGATGIRLGRGVQINVASYALDGRQLRHLVEVVQATVRLIDPDAEIRAKGYEMRTELGETLIRAMEKEVTRVSHLRSIDDSTRAVTLDFQHHVIRVNGVPRRLAPQESKLLAFLHAREGWVTVREILAGVYGIEVPDGTPLTNLTKVSSIRTLVGRIRNKLDAYGYLLKATERTQPTSGYRFDGQLDVEVLAYSPTPVTP